jgi:hypothetical protein
MILTPIEKHRLPAVLDLFQERLGDGLACAVFRRIARPEQADRAAGRDAVTHHAAVLRLLASFGMAIRPGSPREDFGWDGAVVRGGTEAYVLLHELAHFQLAAPPRRQRIDFGLGPGPETGKREAAQAAATLFGLATEREEAMASLLGILWEVEFGHPACASFLDQNWLEGAGRGGAAEHFSGVLAALASGGFLTAEGRPTRQLRVTPDAL